MEFYCISLLESYIIITLSISKNYTSSIVFLGWATLEEFIFRIALKAGSIFSSFRPALLLTG